MARPALKGGSVAGAGEIGSKTHSSKRNGRQDSVLRDAELLVLRLVETNPRISQREIAEKLNVSLGKANYCVRALIDLGWLKIRNFGSSPNKIGYAYALTATGLRERVQETSRFLEKKRAEYEALRAEIEQLEESLSQQGVKRP
ncbi:MAG: MarR family EPS-associated transcriptional regulator [Ahniella sp.]|nr:MarR family EPS-associated transcriptional regulator [Ahniella sp.]